ncbi:uncharacterized protein NECHADRAFT_87651 [Fusarium vanettenii 77-13-4]|uniref:Uncharacterized protein n=1 Tax=Fusarium vanettenii (strain ATCC MYA-4622 / CBS 123669 / FGSC 9596 / NRRL 45880 / 77-13-4) TaxID=660122 RepID=C7Z2M4_FUSV7|nr:uncharacterized protein NECHADRAFT_87651 [Fusarium vanettenii 77-13-4]EEU41690.1 hypothetical protein NECHADRAFT_87651 [Fusarium vanettenii 77-13-4]
MDKKRKETHSKCVLCNTTRRRESLAYVILDICLVQVFPKLKALEVLDSHSFTPGTNPNGWMVVGDKKKWQKGYERKSKSKPIDAVQSENGCYMRLYHDYHLKTLMIHNHILSHPKRPSHALRPDTFLLTFYLDNLLPFLFPFYNPSLLEDGKAWLLEMMISSPVVRQATRCQSSYFFSLAQGQDADWKTVLEQTKDAFSMLGKSLQFIQGFNIMEHVHGAIRILAGIVQLQRYGTSLLSFDNCQAHLSGAVALFKQLLDSVGSSDPRSSFSVVISRLGPSSQIAERLEVPSAEQSAFRFSSALLFFDDIVASTVLQQKPKLYEYHQSLLDDVNEGGPAVDLETVVGCQNWVLIQMGESASLDAWKQDCQRAGNLDVMEMVRIATTIKASLEIQLSGVKANGDKGLDKHQRQFNILTGEDEQQSKTRAAQSSLVTQVWAHAVLIYLSVIVSGWQPASVEICQNVEGVLKHIESPISILPRALLRTMVWPFCVAGCLAEPAQRPRFRSIVEELQPPRVFGTLSKALEIMKKDWREENDTGRDLATCFKGHGDLVLLV